MEKQERKEKRILTMNRLSTINKRETSYEGLADQMENGEDGIYNLISNNNKNVIFRPKITITKKDLEEIEPLRQLRESIEFWERLSKTATGRAAYIIKSTIIELRKDQYIVKNAYRPPIIARNITRSTGHYLEMPWREWVEDGEIKYEGISFLNPTVITSILSNYNRLKSDSRGKFESDTWYLMHDFDNLMAAALADFPLYRRIVEYKTNGYSNIEIQQALEAEFGFTHAIEYISALWRNKIPRLITNKYLEQWLLWYYTEVERGTWKKCSRCGKIKLAHSCFFSINKGSRDGWYSLCKCCRNKRK